MNDERVKWANTSAGFELKGCEGLRAEVFGAAEEAPQAATVKQVHGTRVLSVSEPRAAGEGDGLVTTRRGLGLGVRVADCYPIALFEPSVPVLCLLHAGWRGTLGRIVDAGMDAVERAGGDLARAVAVFGPGICERCFVVGEEVAAAFGRYAAEANGRFRVNLFAASADIASSRGLTRVVPPPTCAYEDERVASARRGDATRSVMYVEIL